jgi:long-chain fatty acid transport protein
MRKLWNVVIQRLLMITLAGLVIVLASSLAYAQCGAICLYEMGGMEMGRSGTGAGAAAQDASTAFWNSAGMTRLDENQLSVGGWFGVINQKLSLNDSTVSVPPGDTNGGEMAGGFVTPPGMGAYAALKLTDDLRFGFTFNGLLGGALDYGNRWVGRSFITENSLLAINLMPSVAYRVTDWLSFGVGMNAVYTSFDQELRTTPGNLKVKMDDADGWGFGYTLSTLIEPRKGTRIGIVYRSEIESDLNGDLQNPSALTPNFNLKMTYARGINVSLFHQVNPKLALLADGGWSDWSAFNFQEMSVGPLTIPVDRGWIDTWRIGLGMQYQINKPWMLQAGMSYDSSPVAASKRTPDLPVGQWWRWSIGAQRKLNERMEIGFSYTFVWFGKGDVDNVALPPNGSVVLDGRYKQNSAHFLGINFKWKFGTGSLASWMKAKKG